MDAGGWGGRGWAAARRVLRELSLLCAYTGLCTIGHANAQVGVTSHGAGCLGGQQRWTYRSGWDSWGCNAGVARGREDDRAVGLGGRQAVGSDDLGGERAKTRRGGCASFVPSRSVILYREIK